MIQTNWSKINYGMSSKYEALRVTSQKEQLHSFWLVFL